ncbi:Aste57867_10380 [Aphanomyces stellatus]|uniref:Aste57867_10380 protein n=1 Tax=Aphanomyces stellatus TaxID=120398 RepID=A0A485KR88_9STRA|nr:hypothetical protein As57867_010340 [Aphanomyces stellatus]VFT87254.1 Aste57867_10380 [Aphanomyces stellatus]
MLKHYLTEAKKKLQDEAYDDALEASTKALELDGMNFQALMFKGKSLFHLQNAKLAETTYRRAVDLQPDTPLVWKGLLEVFEMTNEPAKQIEPLDKLISILAKNEKWDRCQKVTSDLAVAATAAGLYPKALDAWYHLVVEVPSKPALFLGATPNPDTPSELDIWMAVWRIAQAHGIVGPFHSPENILDNVVRLAPTLSWKADDATSQLHTDVVAAINLAVDAAWAKLRQAKHADKTAARRALDALASSLVAACPRATRAAEVRLIRHEDDDGELSPDELARCVSMLAPKSALAHIHRGLALALDPASTVKAVSSLLEGIPGVPEHVGARVALAHLSLHPSALDPARCLDMIHGAFDAVQLRFDTLSTTIRELDETDLNLLNARALIGQNKWADAIMVYEGVVEHDPFLPAGVLGLAEAHLHLDEVDAANNALQFLPPQPTAAYCAVKGWVAYRLGDLDTARTVLESGLTYTDVTWVLKYRLARVYWDMGGEWQTNKAYCVAQLLGAAKLNPHDAGSFRLLGTWYRTVASDNVRAEKCFLKALSLDPACDVAGLALTEMYANDDARRVRLWTDNALQDVVHAPWALLRLAQHQVATDNEAAIAQLHKLLRHAPGNASYWAALGHVYAVFGRTVAAQKSYLKSLELCADSPSVLCELARIELSLGLLDDALIHLTAVASPTVAVQKLLAETLFTQAKALCAQGLYGRADAKLKDASRVLTPATAMATHATLFKLLGDIHVFAFSLVPDDETWAPFLEQGTAAYLNALAATTSDRAAALYDVGVGYWIQAQAAGFLARLPMAKWSLAHAPPYPPAIRSLVETAQSYFMQSLAVDATDAKVWNALGVVHSHAALKQFCLVRAIELENLDAAWANLGMLYLEAGLVGMAQKAFLSLQGVNPNHPAMWLGYGLMECRHGDASQAHAAYTCALELRLDLDILQGYAYTGLWSQSTTSLPQILFALKKYTERDAANAAAINSLGVALMRTGLFAQAVDAFERALAFVQGDATRTDGVLLNLAQALLHLKHMDAAAASLDARTSPHVLLQAQVHVGRGEFAKALAVLESLDATDAPIAVVLAHAALLHRVGRFDDCRRRLQGLTSSRPQDKDAIAALQIRLGGDAWWSPPSDDELAATALSPTIYAPLAAYYQRTHARAKCARVCDAWTTHFPADANGWLARAEASCHFGRLADVTLRGLPATLPYDAHLKRAHILAVVELFGSWTTAAPDGACLKYLHQHPADPRAPLLVTMSLVKRHAKDPTDGVYLAKAKQWLDSYKPVDADNLWLWHVLMSCCDPSAAATHAAAAAATTIHDEVDALARLRQARSWVFADKAKAIDLYVAAAKADGTDTTVAMVELAALLEATGCVKTAWRIWKHVSDHGDGWKSLATIKRPFLQRENAKLPAKTLKELLPTLSPAFVTAFEAAFK